MRSMELLYMKKNNLSIILPFAHRLKKLDLQRSSFEPEGFRVLLRRCPNLEVLHTLDVFGDKGIQLISWFCKKLRVLKTTGLGVNGDGLVSHNGLIHLARGCLKLECLHIKLTDISNVAMECVGALLKNLRDFHILLLKKEASITDLPLDNGVRAMLIGCNKLEKLGICLRPGGLTNVGLGYIGKYGHNLRYMFLGYSGESDAGLDELSKGCPKLRKLEMKGCAFSKKALTTFVHNVYSLRYLWVHDSHGYDYLSLTQYSSEKRKGAYNLNEMRLSKRF